MRVSLIIPIYNEKRHLARFLKTIDGLKLSCEKELVFVDDKSNDGSTDILKTYDFKSRVLLLFQEKNRGKSAALAVGIKQATGDVIGIQDADFEYDPEEIEKLINPILSGEADVVYGSRFKKNNYQAHRSVYYIANRFLTLLSNMASGLNLTDMETCYKFFSRDIIQNINITSRRFGFEPEVTAKISLLKIRIQEYPIRYFPRSYIEGKKITWKDGVATLWYILFYNFLANKKTFFENSW
tara:strand:+ start:239 stop:958 length:720 start_codon:yes stop_codon:yes gene_type:complete